MLEKLLKKLGKLPLKDVQCEFDFKHASQEQFEAFKRSFNIETKIRDWMKGSTYRQHLNEEGKGKFQGMDVELEGPEVRNPNYVKRIRDEREDEREESLDRLRRHSSLLWEAIVKGIISIDRGKMIAFFKTCGIDWDIAYGDALKHFSKIEGKECCK